MKRNVLSTKVLIALLLLLAILIPLTGYTSDVDEELVNVARNNDTATVKALLAKGADVNAKNNLGTPL
jgi:ankyrin repeat protein